MKLAVSNIAWTPEEAEAAYALLASHGFAGLEIAPTAVWPEPYAQPAAVVSAFRQRLAEQGLAVVSFQSLLYGHPELQLFGTDSVRQRMTEHFRGVFELARQLGCQRVVFGSPRNRTRGELDPQAAQAIALGYFGSLGELAQASEVVICLEPNPVVYQADFLTTTQEALDFVQTLNHPAVRLNLDLSTLLLNQETHQLERLIAQHLPWIGHVHLSQPYLEPLAPDTPLHSGLAAALHAAGYQDWVSLEMKRPPQGLVALEPILSFVAEHYATP